MARSKKQASEDARFISIRTGVGRYDMSESAFRKTAEQANAVLKIPGSKMVRIDVELFEKYIHGKT